MDKLFCNTPFVKVPVPPSKLRTRALRPNLTKQAGAGTVVMAENFDNAFLRTQPSVSATDRAFYVSMKDRLCKARAHSSEAPPSGGENDPRSS